MASIKTDYQFKNSCGVVKTYMLNLIFDRARLAAHPSSKLCELCCWLLSKVQWTEYETEQN